MEIHKIFKDWFSDNYQSTPPVKKINISYSKRSKPILTKNGLVGYVFKSSIMEDEVEHIFDN